MKKKILALFFAATIAVSGCAASSGEEANGQSGDSAMKDTIVMGVLGSAPLILEPFATGDPDFNKFFYASLLDINDGEYKPYLAESYEISNDNKKMTFYLNKNAKWHDGEPITAEDVAFTFDCIADKGYAGTGYNKAESIKGVPERHEGKADTVEGIEVIDEHTIEFNFDQPYAPAFFYITSRSIIPEHIWKGIPVAEFSNQVELLKNPIGSGPYKFVEYEEGQQMTFVANDDFFLGKPKTENFIVKHIAPDGILAEYQNGTIDIVDATSLTTDDIDTLKGMGIETESYTNSWYNYIAMNLRETVFQDQALRSALAYAIDREKIVETIYEGRGETLDAPFLPGGWADPDKSDITVRTYDPEKAKSILKDAGYKDNDDDGILENGDGVKLSFTFKYPSGTAATEQTALVVQQSFKEIGVNIELIKCEENAFWEECIYNHDFDMYTTACAITADPDLKEWWHSSSASDEKGVPSWNFGAYKNPELDEVIEQANETLDQGERKELYTKAAQIISEDEPLIFLNVQEKIYAYPEGTKGFSADTFSTYYNIYNWEVPER